MTNLEIALKYREKGLSVIPLNKVGELFVEYQDQKKDNSNSPISRNRKLEKELILEIERLIKSGQFIEMSFDLYRFVNELTERFGNRLQDFISWHLKS